MPTPATLSTLREINASAVLAELRKEPPLSRAEIARRAGMTKPTVANALDLLLAAGLVREAEPPSEIHYGAVYFEPVPDLSYVLGVDIGSRFVRAALSDLDGEMLARVDVPVADSSTDAVLAAVADARERLLRVAERPIELVVAGVPGVVDPDEGVIRQSNREGLEGMPIRADLAALVGAEAQVDNDINLAALGEQAAGAGRGHDDFVFLSVGTGVGAGLILGGRPHRGHRGAAGEVDDPLPGETEAPGSPSADALLKLAGAWIAEGGATRLTLPVTTEQIFAAAADGDRLARRLLDEESVRIADRIVEITRVVDVELVVLGGGIGLACESLMPRIRAEVERLVRFPPRIEISRLGDAPVLVGALARGTEFASRAVAERRIADAATP